MITFLCTAVCAKPPENWSQRWGGGMACLATFWHYVCFTAWSKFHLNPPEKKLIISSAVTTPELIEVFVWRFQFCEILFVSNMFTNWSLPPVFHCCFTDLPFVIFRITLRIRNPLYSPQITITTLLFVSALFICLLYTFLLMSFASAI